MNNTIEPIKIFKALSEETRLRILWLIEDRELSVNDVVEILSSTQSRISRHLTVLKEAGFLDLRKEGTWSYYRKADETSQPKEISEAWKLVDQWGKNKAIVKEDKKKLRQVLQRKKKETHRFFGQHASRWDAIRETLCSNIVTHQAIESLIPRDQVVADVGTGTGHLLIPLARLVDKVIGVDYNKEMLNMAKANAREAGLLNVEFRMGEIDDLPFADAELDAVFAGLVLHHAPDPQSAIVELSRVVRPGGTITIVDLQPHNEEWMREELADQWLGFKEQDLRRWFGKLGFEHMYWVEGQKVQSNKNGYKQSENLKSFVFYTRKPKE